MRKKFLIPGIIILLISLGLFWGSMPTTNTLANSNFNVSNNAKFLDKNGTLAANTYAYFPENATEENSGSISRLQQDCFLCPTITWNNSLSSGDEWNGTLWSDGPVNLYILDQGNFSKLQSGSQFSGYILKGASQYSVDFVPAKSGTYYVVVDNTSPTDRQVALHLSDVSSISQKSVGSYGWSPRGLVLGGVALVAAVALIVLGIRKSKTMMPPLPA